ncbi:MAG: TonB-dependent receptor [Rikenellaceae bacterium]
MNKIHRTESVVCFRRWSRKGYSAFASLHRSVTIGVLWVGMTLISLASNETFASTVDSTALLRTVELRDVGVTHSKGNPTRSDMLSTPIFDRKVEIAAPLQTLESALRLSPSIDVRERGSKGVQADISIRGGSFDQTQVMLNGINFTDARTGHQTHSLPIDIESVTGIELIDGVSGVGAYAGAINIRTAPIKSEDYIRVDLSGGSYGYAYGNLSGGYSKGRFSLFGVGSYRRSDGYTYNTGFENWNGYLRSTYDSERWGFFDAQVGFQRREFGANGFYSLSNPEQYETTHTALGSLRWVKDLGKRLTLNSSVSYRKNLDNYEWIRHSTVGENFHNTDNIGAELYVDHLSSWGKTTLGADYTYNHIWSTNLGEEVDEPNGKYDCEDERNIGNFYLRHTKSWSRYSLSGSVGVSATPYGASPIWSIAGTYTPIEGLVVEAGANESMRLPTFTDLYYSSATQIPDPNLQPESATTYHISSSFARGRWSTNAEVYLRNGRNIIDWTHSAEDGVNDSNNDMYHARQITELTTYGVEWSGSYSVGGFVDRVMLSYGYITQDKSSGDMISLYAQNYMHNKAVASITLRPHPNVSIVLTGSLFDRMGNYMAADGSTIGYEPYATLDGRVSWERGKWRVYLDATNITSTKYYDYGGLEMAPIWVVSGLSYTL